MLFDKNDDKHIIHIVCVTYIVIACTLYFMKFYIKFKCSLKFVRQIKIHDIIYVLKVIFVEL